MDKVSRDDIRRAVAKALSEVGEECMDGISGERIEKGIQQGWAKGTRHASASMVIRQMVRKLGPKEEIMSDRIRRLDVEDLRSLERTYRISKTSRRSWNGWMAYGLQIRFRAYTPAPLHQ
ncbi:MAG: hypothetical protein V2B18_19675, partial [Pseudomonadota bacterium]